MSINFYFDESGYKGNVSEKPNEYDFCLVSGFAIKTANIHTFSAKLRNIFQDIVLNPGEKLHATDIFKDNKNLNIKTQFIDLINKSDLYILHSAIYCIGFYSSLKTFEEITKPSNDSADSRIKPSGIHKNENIYFKAFTDVMVKIDVLCEDNNVAKLNLISDRIDESIKKECQKILVEINKNITEKEYTGFDTVDKVVVSRSIKMQLQGFDMNVNHIKELKIDYANSELTIAADIITNLLFRHIKYKIDNGFSGGLNGTDIFKDFLLKDKIAYLDDNNFYDKMYKK